MPRKHFPLHARVEKPQHKARPEHEPTDELRRMVQHLAPLISPHQVAAILGISIPTYYKYYRQDVVLGRAKAHAVVASVAFKLAAGGNVEMIKHITKTKMGWKEQTIDVDGNEEEEKELSLQTLDALQKELAELAKRRRMLGSDDDDDGDEIQGSASDRYGANADIVEDPRDAAD